MNRTFEVKQMAVGAVKQVGAGLVAGVEIYSAGLAGALTVVATGRLSKGEATVRNLLDRFNFDKFIGILDNPTGLPGVRK